MITALIDLTIKSTALLALGTVIVMVMRRASASSRHHVWVGVLCAIALLPVARLGLPALNVAVLAPKPAEQATPHSPTLITPELALETLPAIALDNPTQAPAIAATPARFVWSLADVIAAIWCLGIAALIVRAAAGQRALRRLISSATAVTDARALAILQEAADEFGVRRRITLLSHADDGLPCTFGLFRPTILMPASLLAPASEAASRLRAVLVHETAHIARLDAISERITQVAVMVFWFNPIVWLAARQARFERERAADDAVLAGGAKASDYASDLLAIARTQSKPMWSSAVPMAVSGLERRVRAILDDRIRRGRHSRLSLVTTLVVLAAMLPVSAVRLVARSAAPPSSVQIEIPSPVAPMRLAAVPSPAPIAAQAPPPVQKVEQNAALAAWNTERERNLRQVLRRARAAHQEALTKVQIGTTVPVDVAVLETTIAQLEQAVKDFAPTTTPLTPEDIKKSRGAFQAVLSRLERDELRFTNGLLTTNDLASTLLAAAHMIDPQIPRPVRTAGRSVGHSGPFLFRPDAPAADRNNARELYSLLTGQVSFAHAAQADPATPWQHVPQGQLGFVYVTGEVRNPGKYQLADSMTVLQLLALAGGLLPSADKNQIVIVSGTVTDKDGKPLTRSVNFNDLISGKNLKENNVQLGPADAVIVRSPGPGYYWQR